MSGWLVCDLLMFGTASYIAFDVSVIMKYAHEGLIKCFYTTTTITTMSVQHINSSK